MTFSVAGSMIRTDGAFCTAVFHVSFPVIYKGLFHDDTNWPEGALLRDWDIVVRMSSTSIDPCRPSSCFGFVSFDLHGLNNSRSSKKCD